MCLHKLCKLRLICIDTECLLAENFSDQPKEYLCKLSKTAVLKIATFHCSFALINSTKLKLRENSTNVGSKTI